MTNCDEDPFVALVRQTHPVHVAATLDAAVDAARELCDGLNPHHADGEFDDIDLKRSLEALRAETGVAVDLDAATLRKLVVRRRRADEEARRYPRGEPSAVCARLSAEDDATVRNSISEILASEIIVTEADASIVFVLDAAHQAPLLHFNAQASTLSALANLGAGRLARLTVSRYAREKARPVRLTSHERVAFDRGDLRIELAYEFDANLEGCILRSVRRRRDEAARRAEEAWDDYD